MCTYYVYIATNEHNSVLYTGVTNNIARRMYEHRNKLVKGFTKKYNIDKLVFVQEFSRIDEAITMEKKVKGWVRVKKIELIQTMNSLFEDLMSP